MVYANCQNFSTQYIFEKDKKTLTATIQNGKGEENLHHNLMSVL